MRRIVEDNMKNVTHPIYNIKALFIKRELAKNPALKDENWEKYLPKFTTKNISKRKQPKKKKIKQPYTPFPPPQTESKVDKELASGEFFLKEKEKIKRKRKALEEKHKEAKKDRETKRAQAFIPPEEPSTSKVEKKSDFNVDEFKSKIKKGLKKHKKS